MNRTTVLSAVLLILSSSILVGPQEPAVTQVAPKILQETFAFPPPIQWKLGDLEVSVIGFALGPVNSPEMLSKAREPIARENAQFFADRPDVLAVLLRATLPRPTQPQTVQLSGLVRIKDLGGSIQYPSALTPLGLVPPFVIPAGVNDIPFKGSDSVEHWDFFPVPSDQREFLFQVIPPSQHSILSFRVTVKDGKFEVINLTPSAESAYVQFTKNYAGTMGAESGVSLQVGVAGVKVSGFGKHTQSGKSFWLKGQTDSLGNFKLNEYHPENQLTGRLDGKFSEGYRQMSGYFSKPDGSNLEPFDFRRTDEAGYGGEGIGIAPCPVPNTPGGWKTYINESYRFCFSYPSTYAPIAEPWSEKYMDSTENSGEVRELVQEKRLFMLQDTQQSGALVSVVVDTEPLDLQTLARSAPTGNVDSPEPKVFSNQVFYYYGPGGGGVDYADRFFYDLKCKTLIFTFGPPSDNNVTSEKTREIEPQILATFRTY